MVDIHGVTVLGHYKIDYADPIYMQHIFQGISFIAGSVKKLDSRKAYAGTRDDTILRLYQVDRY